MIQFCSKDGIQNTIIRINKDDWPYDKTGRLYFFVV